MKITNRLLWLSLAVSIASSPVSARDKKPESGNDRDEAVHQCYLHAQTVADFELCNWLRMVADGQPTEWLEWRGAGWR